MPGPALSTPTTAPCRAGARRTTRCRQRHPLCSPACHPAPIARRLLGPVHHVCWLVPHCLQLPSTGAAHARFGLTNLSVHVVDALPWLSGCVPQVEHTWLTTADRMQSMSAPITHPLFRRAAAAEYSHCHRAQLCNVSLVLFTDVTLTTLVPTLIFHACGLLVAVSGAEHSCAL